MIKLEHLSKTYDTPQGLLTALDDIHLEVKPGEIYGVIGKSGAGKSTLIRCINRLDEPSHGKVIIDGEDIVPFSNKALRDKRRNIAMIFQHFNLLSSRTVKQNIAFPLELIGLSKTEINQRIQPLLELTGLVEKQEVYPAALSGGQKQRVAIARALASQPKILLCDEATSALDPETTASILELLQDINRKLNLTILLITHEMDVVKRICDKVAVIEAGRIIERGTVRELFTNAQTNTAKNFIQASLHVNLPNVVIDSLKNSPAPGYDPLVQLSFQGDTTYEPLISQLSTEYHLQINILQANIEPIKQDIMGMMVVQLHGSTENIQQASTFLTTQGLHAEVLGYVPSHDPAID